MRDARALHVAWPGAEADVLTDLRRRIGEEADHPVVMHEVARGEPLPPKLNVLVAGRPGAALLEGAAGLESLVIPFAGVPAETLALLRERPALKVYNLHHNAEVVAESALALALAAAREVVPSDVTLRRGDWGRRVGADGSRTLRGGRALLYGYGAIGRALAPMLQGLDMEVWAVRRSVEAPRIEGAVRMLPASMLREAVGQADLVVLCAPSTDETRGVFGRALLSRFAPGSVLVNVGRGDLVDAAALRDALVTGPLHSAALDVWWNYPRGDDDRSAHPPADVELSDLQNLVFSPHRSGHCADIEARRRAALATVLAGLAEGRDLPGNRVDVARGY